jgi:hypothetical protein
VIRRVCPDQRLDRLEFSPRTESVAHAIDVGAYACPHCGERVEFTTRHFGRHALSTRSNLETEWRERFDAERPLDRSRWESFLDFHCPGCRAPVRIVYESGGEVAMGVHAWRIVEVLESSEAPGAPALSGRTRT